MNQLRTQTEMESPTEEAINRHLFPHHAEIPALSCSFCSQPIADNDIVIVCPKCGMLHHSSCWQANEARCTRFGCTGEGAFVVHNRFSELVEQTGHQRLVLPVIDDSNPPAVSTLPTARTPSPAVNGGKQMWAPMIYFLIIVGAMVLTTIIYSAMVTTG